MALTLVGEVLSGAGIASGRRTGAGNRLAIAGLVLGIVALAPAVVVIAAAAVSFA